MPQTDPTVGIHIVTWNSLTHLSGCLESVMNQSRPATSVMVVDNASVDGTVTWLEEHYPHVHLLRNTRNVGFCRAHNQALRLSHDEYVLILNPDVILDQQWLDRAIAFLVSHPAYGSFGGKTLRYSYSSDELKEVQYSGIIDSTGLRLLRSRHAIDRGSGEEDHGQYDHDGEVFGFSGACVLFRRAALEGIRWRDEYLDESIFAYKDDIDLAWRLQLCGWPGWYDHAALAYHHRHLRGVSAASDLLLAKNHRGRSAFLNFYSYRNQWLILLKHETWSTFWRDGLWITLYEFKKTMYYLVTQPSVVRGLFQALRLWPQMRQKGRLLRRQAARSPLAVRQWFVR